MRVARNPFRGTGLTHASLDPLPWVSADTRRPVDLLLRCPRAAETPLVSMPRLATELGVSSLYIKDERARMGLGSFKALGAAYVIARDAEEGLAEDQTYITASAGNHGLSVAAGASAFRSKARVFLSEQVPEAFAQRLSELGADVARAGSTYEESMEAAARNAEETGSILLSDSSWPGYIDRPHTLMEGYLVLMDEAVRQMPEPPTHILLQAGVGGLAAASAASARARWGDQPDIIVVEPEAAPALFASIEAGAAVTTKGPASNMGRLDCKEPSLLALKSLARDADAFATITEEEGEAGSMLANRHGVPSTPSGAAGLAALAAGLPGIDRSARPFIILSEGPE